jgi:crossover junction endodeoxyribonuclease RuvC
MVQSRSCRKAVWKVSRPLSLSFCRLPFPAKIFRMGRQASALSSGTRVIGIDPGLSATGYGIIACGATVRLVEAGIIRLPPSQGDNLPARLELLFTGMRGVIGEFQPEAMCLEEVYSHAAYPRTSVLMGHARGVICLAARLAGVRVVSVPAKRIKQSITGNGNASKVQVQRAVQSFFSLRDEPRPPDVADALAAALCFADLHRSFGNGWQVASPNQGPLQKRKRAPQFGI